MRHYSAKFLSTDIEDTLHVPDHVSHYDAAERFLAYWATRGIDRVGLIVQVVELAPTEHGVLIPLESELSKETWCWGKTFKF